ncbi:unnamed protein product [Ixodes persulcatus]
MLAVLAPRRSSLTSWPVDVSNTLMSVPCVQLPERTFSEAVASRLPSRLRAMQLRGASWASMSSGGFSVCPRSTS